jgi:predicted DNA-binding protein
MDKERKESVVVSVTLKQDMVSKLDEFALKIGIKTNALIREFIDEGLRELSTAKKCDIVEKAFFVMVFLDQHLRFSKEKKGAEGKNQRSITISVRIGKEENEALDKWAIELGKTKNRIIESLIRFRIDELIMVKHVGLLDVSIGLVKLENKIIKIWEKRFKKAQQISNEMFKFEVK